MLFDEATELRKADNLQGAVEKYDEILELDEHSAGAKSLRKAVMSEIEARAREG